MNPLPILSQRYRISINDIDFTKKIKPSAIFNYFQEIANMHSENLGVGLDTIRTENGVMWVLIKIRVDIIRYPLWDEEIIVETWPQTPRKYEFERDFIITGLNGEILVRGISSWVILDTETHELKKSDTIKLDRPEPKTTRALDCTLGKIRLPEEFELIYKRLIGCSDIDINCHLNNSKYIDFIMDCFTMDQLRNNKAKSIQVNYLNEAMPGDTILIYKHIIHEDPHKILIKGVRETGSDLIFSASLETSPL
jgi:Acyl-ACP thioesterase